MTSGMTAHSHHGYPQGLATPEFTRKQPVSVPGIMSTEAVVANRCHVQALLSLGAGVRYDVTPDIALDLSYRYLDAGDSSVSYKDEWGDKYKSEVDVKSHDIMLGMTYNF